MQLASIGASRLSVVRQALYRHARHNPLLKKIPLQSRNASTPIGKHLSSHPRHFLSKLVSYLTTPGIWAPRSGIPSYHSSARTTIQQRLSLPVRTALSRTAYLPRAPSVPRSVFQVGLGTAHKFLSAQPVFPNLVQNVPVAARAFCEADIDLKPHKRSGHRTAKNSMRASEPQAYPSFSVANKSKSPPSIKLEVEPSELEHYFPSPSIQTATFLYIPLVPTASESMLPPDYIPERDSLLPLPALVNVHNSHEMHNLRVSSLFSRLDAASVWDKNVKCSAFSHLENEQGVCTILKIEFIGWTKAEVRAVIGESGTGWCALEEVFVGSSAVQDGDDDLTSSDATSIFSGSTGAEVLGSEHRSVEPSDSLVLPTLDLTASFDTAEPGSPTSPALSGTDSSSSRALSDWQYMSDSSAEVAVEAPVRSIRMGFSLDFLQGHENEPFESVF